MSTPENQPESPPGTKSTGSGWERRDVWVKVGIPTLATVVLGVATFWVDHRVSQRAEQEQASRLYTELISRREQAASDLRKDMFATILSGFLDPGKSTPILSGSKRLDQDLLKLEILALNFGDALSLGPLFAMVDRRIRTDASYDSKNELLDRPRFQNRLESLARRVADAQRGSLASQSTSITVDVPRGVVGEVGSYAWPDTPRDERLACLVLGQVQRRVALEFSNVNREAKRISVTLGMETARIGARAPPSCTGAFKECADLPAECGDHVTTHYSPPTKPFTIDFFNLPLIDNSLLSDDQRFSLVMREFGRDSIEVVGILFPGAYAGRRDKLTLDQAIEALKGRID